MPIPRPGDPLHVLRVAASSLRLVGGILLLVATLGALSIVIDFSLEQFFSSNQPLVQLFVRLVPYLFVGAALLVTAFFIERGHLWAAILGMVLSGLVTLAGIIVTAALVVMTGMPEYGSPWICIPILLVALFTFAVGQLTFHLTQALSAIRSLHPLPQRGFEAIPPVHAAPLPPPPLSDQHQTS